MKKILIALLIIVLGGCTTTVEEDKIKYNKITAEEAKEVIDKENVIIMDVRTPEEYEEEHIEGALLIPNYDLKDLSESKLPDKDAKVLVYCSSGNRCKSAKKYDIIFLYKISIFKSCNEIIKDL